MPRPSGRQVEINDLCCLARGKCLGELRLKALKPNFGALIFPKKSGRSLGLDRPRVHYCLSVAKFCCERAGYAGLCRLSVETY